VQELHAHGAVTDGDVAGTSIWHQYGHAKLQFDAGLRGVLRSKSTIFYITRHGQSFATSGLTHSSHIGR